MSGSVTQELRMVGTALVGNQMQYTNESFKASKFNKFMGLHHRDAVAGVHADAFVRPELRDQGQQSIPLLTNPEQGPPPGDDSANGHPDSVYLLWQQQQNQAPKAV